MLLNLQVVTANQYFGYVSSKMCLLRYHLPHDAEDPTSSIPVKHIQSVGVPRGGVKDDALICLVNG